MLLLVGALVAGVLTTLAPCVLPLLPVIVGRSALGSRWRPFVMTASLGASIALFTVLLKVTAGLIPVSPAVWPVISGGLLVVLGVIGLFPAVWEGLSGRLSAIARQGMASARRREGVLGDVLAGAALGPVFSACSPLYGYVVVTALPASPAFGALLLLAYCVGLCGTLLLVALLGRRLIGRLGWAADSHGWLRRGLGLIFIIVGLAIAFGLDKALQAWMLQYVSLDLWTLDSAFVPSP